jgi:SNF2 family DNA or RNA helicase
MLLFETLEESTDLGHRSLIFSQWTSLLDLVETRLKEKNISFSRLDGSTRNRDQVVSAFQKETGPTVMLLSLKAGGVGITLTAADHIYILDPWWNPAAEDQAADRAHRIGQENPVFIHRLVARDTVEDKILQLQKKKKALAEGVIGGAEQNADFTKEELLQLLHSL